MVGETHLEIVRHGEDIEIYLSDAYRRPMNAVGGRISFGDEPATALVWNEDRLSAHDDPRFDVVTIQVRFPDGTDLDINATIAKRPAS